MRKKKKQCLRIHDAPEGTRITGVTVSGFARLASKPRDERNELSLRARVWYESRPWRIVQHPDTSHDMAERLVFAWTYRFMVFGVPPFD